MKMIFKVSDNRLDHSQINAPRRGEEEEGVDTNTNNWMSEVPTHFKKTTTTTTTSSTTSSNTSTTTTSSWRCFQDSDKWDVIFDLTHTPLLFFSEEMKLLSLFH